MSLTTKLCLGQGHSAANSSELAPFPFNHSTQRLGSLGVEVGVRSTREQYRGPGQGLDQLGQAGQPEPFGRASGFWPSSQLALGLSGLSLGPMCLSAWLAVSPSLSCQAAVHL